VFAFPNNHIPRTDSLVAAGRRSASVSPLFPV